MEKFYLIGAYQQEGREEDAKCIDTMMGDNNGGIFEDLQQYIWHHQRENLDKFDIIFVISEDMKIVARVSSMTDIDYLKMKIEDDGDLKDYSPVYVDIAEHDERVLISNILNIDLV